MKAFWYISVLAFGVYGCNNQQTPFVHQLTTTNKPWSSSPKPRDGREFTFAIIGDLNGEEREGIFDVAAQQLKLLRPDFVVTIGDLVNGGTEDTVQFKKELDNFDARAAQAEVPFFHMGGNHDLTNPIMRQYWEKRYGRRYYHFVYQDVLFLILDSEDFEEKRMQQVYLARKHAIELLDSGKREEALKTEYFQMKERAVGEIREEQSAYFEKVLAENKNVRWTFLFMHKPVWQREGDGNLSKIQKALEGRNYTVVNGHLHAYAYSEQDGHDYIMMGTTGGGQNASNKNAFDHVTLVTMVNDVPQWVNLRLDGVLDKKGQIPLDGDKYCYQASKCGEPEAGEH